MTAGFSALVAAIMFGKRINKHESTPPNDVPMILLGAALLWFGWFGFNAGSAITSGILAAHAFVTTFVGAAAAMVSWLAVDWWLYKKPPAVGAAIGLVVGLVVVTPAAGFVSVPSAIAMCGLSGIICNFVARAVKKATHLDDALDVFACHGMGGLLGAIGTGLLASKAINPAVAVDGLLIGGEFATFKANLFGVVAVGLYAPLVTFVLLKLINVVMPLRVSHADEAEGLDTSIHGEMAKFNAPRVLNAAAR
jgi:Amt family ammonium transporter